MKMINMLKPLLFFLASFPMVATALATESARPNFLIIFIDDMGYGDLGCFAVPLAAL